MFQGYFWEDIQFHGIWGTWVDVQLRGVVMMMYDSQLLRDIREGRAKSLDEMVIEDGEYDRLAEVQKEKWKELEDMGLPAETLTAVEEYSDLCLSRSERYVDLMYELGLRDGLHLGRM